LPEDAVSKGYQTIIQDILITPINTQFTKDAYYSPSLKKNS
jgi:hypothetical protein